MTTVTDHADRADRVGRPPALATLRAIVAYTWRSCLPPRRLAGVVLACGAAVLFGLLSRVVDDVSPTADFANVAAEGIFGLVLPIAALVVGDAVLGAEIRSGAFHFTWLTPVPTWQIVLGRWFAGAVVAVVAITPAVGLAAFVSGSASDTARPAMLAAAVGSVSYIAVFVAVGCITKRTAVWSLAIVFLIERLLGAALTGIAQLSPQWESRAVFVGLLDDPPRRLVRSGIPAGGDAIVRLAVIAIVALAIANWRMRRLTLSGASD